MTFCQSRPREHQKRASLFINGASYLMDYQKFKMYEEKLEIFGLLNTNYGEKKEELSRLLFNYTLYVVLETNAQTIPAINET